MATILTKGSLCSGTGALDDAVPGALQWVSEVDSHASAVLKRERPEAPNLGDLTAYRWSSRERVDLLTSGDPCQSMSAAGRRMASADQRFLWPSVLDVVRAVQPSEVFLENVQDLVSVPLVKGGERGGVLRMRLGDLREAGYAVRWTVFGACAVGAPHHRHRWFLRAWHVGTGAAEAERVAVDRCGAPRNSGRPLLPTPRATDVGTEGRRSSEGWRPQLGQAVHESWSKFTQAVALWEEITGRAAPTPTVPSPKGGSRLNPELSEWMMGLRLGHVTADMPRSAALRLAGNGVVELQARAAWGLLGVAT